MKSVLIFDFDGTIADSYDIFYRAFGEACRECGIRNMTSDTFANIFNANMFEGLQGIGLPADAVDLFMQNLETRLSALSGNVELFHGMEDILNTLGETSVIYVITSNLGPVIEEILAKHSVRTVQAVLGSDVDTSKVRKIKSIKDEYPGAVIRYYGDTCGDIVEARQAGVEAVAVAWGWHNREQLQQIQPDRILDNPSDLLDE